VRQEAQAPVRGFLIVAGTQQEQARQEQKRDPGPTCGRPDQGADSPPNKHAGDGHASLEEREDQGDAQPIPSLESRDAERGAQGEGVEGEGEEKPGRDQELAHRVSELNKLPCTSNARSVILNSNMRTLATQVKLRRLIRAFGEARIRLMSEPTDRRIVGSTVDRLLELAGDLRESWRRENALTPLEAPLERYVKESLRTVELAVAGLRQAGADLELLQGDFESAALPLEVFLRGLDAEPALQRSA